MTRRIATAYFFALTACGGGPAPTPETASRQPPASESEKPAPAAPTPAATGVPAPKSPFSVIGEVKEEVHVYGVGERGFVASEGGILFSLVGDDVIHDPLLQRGFSEEPMFALTGITGVWPNGAWLSTTHPSGRSGFTKLWNWDGKRWANKQSTSESRVIMGIRPWIGGRMLAIEQAAMMFDASFRVVSGDKNAAVPTFTKRKNPQSFCQTEVQAQAFETLPTGEIFVVGPQCNDEEVIGVAVERWASGARKGTLESLPGTSVAGELGRDITPSIAVTGMVVRSATDVVVSAERDTFYSDTKKREIRTHIAQFDGSRWQEKSSPIPGFVKSLSAASDGMLFVTNDRGEIYSGRALDALALVPLPAELLAGSEKPRVVSLWSRAPGDVWAVVGMFQDPEAGHPATRHVLVHTRPAKTKLPTVEEFQQKERAYRLPGPPVEWCTTPFVLLYTLGRKAPADYEYPSTRVALRGHPEFGVEGVEFLEFERTGKRFFGARVPDFTLGKKLATLVKEKVPGSTPELVCHDPPPLRTLPMDLTPAKN